MPDYVVIAVLAVGGLVAFLIYKGVLAAREAKAERVRGLRALGFEPLDSPPGEVRDAILALHQRGRKPEHKISGMFERRGSSGGLYLFDLEDRSGESSRDGMVAVFSPRLEVPRLTIFPRLEGEGRFSALGNLLLKKLGQRHGGTIDLTAHPRFARRHFVSGPDHEAIRRFLNERRLDRLAEMEHIGVEAHGDHFTCARLRLGRRRSGRDRAAVARHVELAEALLRVLEG